MVNEVELVLKSISGDTAAFSELIKIYQRRVFGFIKSKVNDSTDVEDLVQESLPNLYYGEEIPQLQLNVSMEEIMYKIDIIKKGEYVIRALSLEDQLHLCKLASNSEKFDNQLLSSFGKIDGGKEFVSLCEGRLIFKDMISILTYSRDVETWVINNLEIKDAELAEKYKMNMFVFEDIILLPPDTVKKIVSLTESEIMLTALIASGVRIVKQYVASFIDEEVKNNYFMNIINKDMKDEDSKAAIFEVIQTIYSLVQNGDIEVAPPTKEVQAEIDSYLKEKKIFR